MAISTNLLFIVDKIHLAFSVNFPYASSMTKTEIQAWEIITQMTPAQQYYLALKILQGFQPKEVADVSEKEAFVDHPFWSNEEEVAELILKRKQQLEDGSVKVITPQQSRANVEKRLANL